MFNHYFLATLITTLSFNVYGAFFCKKAKIATTLAIAQRLKPAPLRTLIYDAYSNPETFFDTVKLARTYTQAQVTNVMQDPKSKYHNLFNPIFFAWVANPKKHNHAYMFESLDDFKRLLDATNPECDTAYFPISGLAKITIRKGFNNVLVQKQLYDLYIPCAFKPIAVEKKIFAHNAGDDFNPKSYMTMIEWYGLNSTFYEITGK